MSKVIEDSIYIPIYDFYLKIYIGDNILSQYNSFVSGDKNPKQFEFKPAGITCFDFLGKFGLFFDKKELSYSLIAHECHHLVNYVFNWIDTPITVGNDESSARLMQYLVKTIIDLCRNNKIKIKV